MILAQNGLGDFVPDTPCWNTWDLAQAYKCATGGTLLADAYQKARFGDVPYPVAGTPQPLPQTFLDSNSPTNIINASIASSIADSAAKTDAAIQKAIDDGSYDPNGSSLINDLLGVPGWAWALGAVGVGLVAVKVLKPW